MLFLLFVLPAVSHAQVSKIVFTTEPQTVKPSEISGTTTIQTQDSLSVSTAVGETSDVFVTSSSATGEFSSNAMNWESVTKMTMNKNWANRTFYYKDSTVGTYTISVKVVGRTSLKEWNASQTITVSNANDTDVAVKMEEQRFGQIALIQTQISELQQKLVVIVEQKENRRPSFVPEIRGFEKEKSTTTGDNKEKDVEKLQSESQRALAVEAVPEVKRGIIGRWLEILKRFFLRTQ